MQKIERLDTDKIKDNLQTKRIGKKVLLFNSTSSTQLIAGEYAKNPKNDGIAIFAEEQTQGRGRAGREWLSQAYESILCSVLLIEPSSTEILSLACAVAVSEAIDRNVCQIKWPNDVVLNGRKVAGILLESRRNNGTISYILGVGINCHQKESTFPKHLRQRATSIDIESNSFCDRNTLAKRLLTSMDYWLEKAKNNSQLITQKWRELSIQLHHRVKLLYNGREFNGNCIGLDPQKGLIVQLDSGAISMFDALHTSIIN